jgi:polyhydroxybutyrate depolymerase
VDGMERSYWLHLPPGISSAGTVPLVFVFHGFSAGAEYIRLVSGFDAAADAAGFVVVYPNGSGPDGGRSWNAGDCCGSARQNQVSEAVFVRAILQDAGTLAEIDPNRVYAAGFSNGAMLSYRLACEMADTFAAVAPVAGVLQFGPCEPSRPVSVIHIHGTTDAAVPFQGGGRNSATNLPFPPVEDSIAAWVGLDECNPVGEVQPDGVTTRTVYSGCREGTAVELYMIQGVGHNWPQPFVFPATQRIWEFFAAHARP